MKEHPLENLSEIYLRSQNFSLRTLKSYRTAYKYFILYLKEREIIYAKTRDVIGYRDEKRNLGYSTYAIHIHLCALRGLYRYLNVHHQELKLPDVYLYDIMKSLQNEKIKNQLNKHILSMDEAKQLIMESKRIRKYTYHYRNHAIVYLMLTAGIRRDEIIRLKRDDYTVTDGAGYLTMRKKNPFEDQVVKLSAGGKLALDEYLMRRKDDCPYLFVSSKQMSKNGSLSHTFFQNIFPRILEDCGLSDRGITPHVLRHTAGVINLMRGGSILETQKFLRHQSIASTLVYQDYIDKMNDRSEELIEAFILKEDGYLTYEAWLSHIES
ncbi:MAG: tyrosine-type recombinase/integrase [Acholeplasma sp.]|nr:tyrosine-type recombinase/integrase [Acholeplasma sp.]